METISSTGATSYADLHSFADVKVMLGTVRSHRELCALVDAVEERFASDRQQLHMTDADWHEWTRLVALAAAIFENHLDVGGSATTTRTA